MADFLRTFVKTTTVEFGLVSRRQGEAYTANSLRTLVSRAPFRELPSSLQKVAEMLGISDEACVHG